MKAKRCCGLLAAVGILLAAGIVWAADEPKSASARVEVRTESERGGPPRVRMWVNGREVEPGRPPVEAAEPGESGRAFLGVGVGPLSAEAQERTGAEAGAMVVQVMPDSPAAGVGLQVGDVITAIGEKPVRSPQDVVEAIRASKPGQTVCLVYRRDGEEREARFTELRIAWKRESSDFRGGAPEKGEAEERAFLGILAAPLSDDMREIAGTGEGVLVDSLTDSSPAAKAGLLPGDVITRIDGQPVTTLDELVERLRTRKPGDEIEVTYYRMGKRQETRVTLGEAPARESRAFRSGPLLGLPEGLLEELPRLREYLEGVRPQVEQWMKKWREPREESPEEREPPWLRPLVPPVMPGDPYGIGKDIGRLLERMDRIERRLDEIERSLDEEFEAIQRQIDRIHEENNGCLERLERRAERLER
jgi:hypothetical protein